MSSESFFMKRTVFLVQWAGHTSGVRGSNSKDLGAIFEPGGCIFSIV